MLRINYLISVPIRLAIMALLNAHRAISHKREKYFSIFNFFGQRRSFTWDLATVCIYIYISGLCLTRATRYQSTRNLA